jgi:UDP-2-acetamido-2,6-beta-L-arabino-hexul-4-ose reductase
VRIGITGWRGFIGSHLAKQISNPVLFQGNMRDLGAVKEFVGQCDRIYHLAGKNRAKSGEILTNNVVGTANLVLATKLLGVNPEIVFASSQQVEWNPDSEYGIAKIVEEHIIRKARKWLIFRIPNVYGEGCKPKYNSVVATFCCQIVNGEKVTISDPKATREFVYVGDLVAQLIQEADNPYRIVRVAGEVLRIQEIYELLTAKLGEHENLKKTLDWYSNHYRQEASGNVSTT